MPSAAAACWHIRQGALGALYIQVRPLLQSAAWLSEARHLLLMVFFYGLYLGRSISLVHSLGAYLCPNWSPPPPKYHTNPARHSAILYVSTMHVLLPDQPGIMFIKRSHLMLYCMCLAPPGIGPGFGLAGSCTPTLALQSNSLNTCPLCKRTHKVTHTHTLAHVLASL